MATVRRTERFLASPLAWGESSAGAAAAGAPLTGFRAARQESQMMTASTMSEVTIVKKMMFSP